MPTVILPSENQTREFDAKLLLACCLAERGFDVVVGARHEIHSRIAEWPQGIYVAKDFRKPSERILEVIQGLGHHIVAWDEEGFVQPLAALYYQRRITAPAISKVESCFAWGPANKRLMRNAPGWPDIPIYETGNPRLDMLRPELRPFFSAEVSRLTAELGAFVLFDSNFASLNPAIVSVPGVLVGSGNAQTNTYLAGRKRLFARWQDLVPAIAAQIFPAILVVRPHPAESHALWRSIANGKPNIRVIHEGSAIPWLIAARAMVHSGCSTGAEAYLLGKPAIAFRPENLVPLEDDLPDALSLVASSEEDVLLAIKKYMRQRFVPTVTALQKELAADNVYALDNQLACDRIADVLVHVSKEHTPARRRLPAVIKANWRRFEKALTGLNPSHKTSAANNYLRYPGEPIESVRNKCALFSNSLNRFRDIGVQRLGGEVHLVRHLNSQIFNRS